VMNNVLLSTASATALGTSLPVGGQVPLGTGAAFTAARPMLRNTAEAVPQQVTCEMYQHKARIAAANGGDTSGSHPAWDPV
jgi:TPP-dependent pyruvate/acetoin dehydrogenase alpha subunit